MPHKSCEPVFVLYSDAFRMLATVPPFLFFSAIHPGPAVVSTWVAVLAGLVVSVDETSSGVSLCAASTGSVSLSVLSFSGSR